MWVSRVQVSTPTLNGSPKMNKQNEQTEKQSQLLNESHGEIAVNWLNNNI